MGAKRGRPRVWDIPNFKETFSRILPRLIKGQMSLHEGARILGVSIRTLRRYVNGDY
jgi:hypothetical protein